MKLFLDSSVLLAALASPNGASRELFRSASVNGWELLTTPYVISEVTNNLPRLPASAETTWTELQLQLSPQKDILTLDRPAVFQPAKDRPILFSALAWSDVLLTLDRADFGALLGHTFYALPVLTPGAFLERMKSKGNLA